MNILNRLRDLHGCPKVKLDLILSSYAQQKALGLSKIRVLGSPNFSPYGQNLLAVPGFSSVSYKAGGAVLSWY